MKQISLLLLFVLAVGFAFWGGRMTGGEVLRQKSSATDSISEQQVALLLHEVAQNYFRSLEKGVDNAAASLSQNREFVLSYFHDNDLTNPVIKSAAADFGKLLGLDAFTIKSGDGTAAISTWGVEPLLESIGSAKRIVEVVDNSVWVGVQTQAQIGGKELLLTGWKEFDTSALSAMSDAIKSELILKRGDSIVMSTLSSIESVHMTEPDRIIVGDSEVPVITVPLTDSLALLSFYSTEGSM